MWGGAVVLCGLWAAVSCGWRRCSRGPAERVTNRAEEPAGTAG